MSPDETEPTPQPEFPPAAPPAPGPEDAGYDAPAAAFVERFAADMTEGGVQRMASRVFACLLASEDGALSSAQLAERLRVSPAAVSGAVRYLSQVHMVSREREPGSRRELYRVHENVWFEALLDRDQLLTRWRSTLRTGVAALGPGSRAGRRIQETHDFLEFIQGELSGILERWYALRRGQQGHGTGAGDGTGGATDGGTGTGEATDGGSTNGGQGGGGKTVGGRNDGRRRGGGTKHGAEDRAAEDGLTPEA